MKVIIETSARECLINIFDYNFQYSSKNAIETDRNINLYIYNLENLPYIGRNIPQVSNKHFRELIFKRNKNSYRIVYYVSEFTNTIYVLYVANSKQDFNRFLKLHNYFNNFLKF